MPDKQKNHISESTVSLRMRLCRMMTKAATAALLLDTLIRAVLIEPTLENCLIPFLSAVATAAAYAASQKCNFGGKGYFLLLFVSNMIMLPLSFMLSGGTDSGNPIWLLLGVTMIFLLLDGVLFAVMLVMTLAVDVSLFFIGANFPELIVQLDHVDARKDAAASLLIGAMIVGILFMYQSRLYREERELSNKRQKEIEDLSQAKSLFFANMSHEIRTPINTVIGLNEMILREDISDEVAENAVNIQKASKLLLTTINDILDLSKLESGNMEIVPEQYETAAMFKDLVNMVWIRATQKKLELRTDIAENIPSVLLGDELRIKQVLANILTNAVKYTENGSVMLTVKGEELENDIFRLKIAVEDTGIGIRKENISELFTVFKQMDKVHNKKIEGTGLGLAITKQLVDMMGGEIKVDSIYQKGSCFTVTLDQKIIDHTPIGSESFAAKRKIEKRKRYQQSFEAPEAKVLIVDDNEMNLMVARKLLRDTKVQVDTASGGAECLEKTEANNYHVILMDHMMPGMDGEETLKKLRSRTDGYCQNTPVIALTANVMTNAAAWYRDKGFDGYLAKPISGSLLEAALKKFLPSDFIEYAAEDEPEEEEKASIVFHNRKMKICISVDGICDLPQEWVEKLNIRLIYYYVTTEEGRFIDTREISSEELLGYISGDRNALSSSASVGEYENFFSDRLMEAEQVIHISTASQVGEGFNNAVKAADGFDNVTVFNSGHLSSGMGFMALHAAKMAQDGFDRKDILQTLNRLREKVSTSFIVPNGENMYRNGRISKTVLRVCSALQIRPILQMRNSKISLGGFASGSIEHAAARYVRRTLKHSGRIDEQLLFLTNAGVTVKQLEKIRSDIEQHKKFSIIKLQKASSAISCNCGKGCFGLIYVKK